MNHVPAQGDISEASKVEPGHRQLVQILDQTPMGLPHDIAWFLSTGGTLLDGYSVFMLGIAIPLLAKDMGLAPLQTGLMGAALVAGAMLGAFLGGRIGDRVGRKSVYLIDMGIVVLATILSALAWAPWLLTGALLATGVGIGMDFPVSSSYVAECLPQHSRGRMMVATIAAQSVGMLLAAVVALGLLRLSDSPQAWRLFFASEGIIAALFLVARLYLPESPRWLMGQGRNREAVHALEYLAPGDRRMLEALATRLGGTIHHVARVPKRAAPMGLSVLFHPAYRRRTLLSSLPWFLMDIATYGVGLFTAVLLASLQFDAHAPTLVVRAQSLAGGSGLIDLFLLLGFLLGMWAVNRFGRIRMQLSGFAGMAVGMGILFAASLLPGGAPQHVVLIFCGFVVFNLSMNMGPNSTTYILPAELFPTQARATAVGFAAACAKIGATAGVLLLPLLKNALGVPDILALMAGISLLGMGCTWLFRVEGHGLTLEQHHSGTLP